MRSMRWLAAVLAVVVLGGAGCESEPNRSDVELGYLEHVEISGYTPVRRFYEKSAIGIYVGRPVTDVKPLISGPELEITAPSVNLSRTVFDHVADGVGHTEDGKECHLTVYGLRSGTAPFPDWKLSDEQARQVAAGEAKVIQIEMGCEPFQT